MDVFDAGSHGSTFGGKPIAGAIGIEALDSLKDEKLTEKSAELGEYLKEELKKINSPYVREVRGAGLWVGVDIDPVKMSARTICEQLQDKGILCKETHETIVRFAPPLTITKEEINWALEHVRSVLSS